MTPGVAEERAGVDVGEPAPGLAFAPNRNFRDAGFGADILSLMVGCDGSGTSLFAMGSTSLNICL